MKAIHALPLALVVLVGCSEVKQIGTNIRRSIKPTPAERAEDEERRKAAAAEEAKSFTVAEYDKFKDQTDVHMRAVLARDWGFWSNVPVNGVYGVKLEMATRYLVKGDGNKRPSAVGITFFSFAHDWVFLKSDRRLIVISGERRFDLGALRHDGDVKPGNPNPDITETMWTDVRPDGAGDGSRMELRRSARICPERGLRGEASILRGADSSELSSTG